MEVSEVNTDFARLFRQTLGFDEEEFALLLRHCSRKFLDKKQHYLREGETCRYKAYLHKGCTRTYVVDQAGKEHIHFFAFEDWWLGDFESYQTGKPAKLNIQALEDSELILISKEDFSRLEQQIPKLQQWYFVKIQPMQFATFNRLNETKIATPRERYETLLKKHPDILQRVPLQYIAAYLDIEPQSFSRMRNRMAKEAKKS